MGVLERQAYTATTALSGLRGGRHMCNRPSGYAFSSERLGSEAPKATASEQFEPLDTRCDRF
jgi:hypothetical protein